MSKTQEIFQQLEGKWHIKRNIIDFAEGYGEAEFKQTDQNNLFYSEKLNLTLNTCASFNDAHQEYYFEYDSAIDVITKYRSSKELMYKIKIEQDHAVGLYQCKKDTYIAYYDFIDDKKFTLTYDVKGPDKKYTIVTEFERVMASDDVEVVSNTVAIDVET